MVKALDLVLFLLVITVLWFLIINLNILPDQQRVLLFTVPILFGAWIVGILNYFMQKND
jgi:hypothetical protein